ncbi:thiamine transporter substrate binding subunit [Antarctobacter heliothermus]|uniref:Thiamine transporter substrate binding subunit n=1 Tax=Antarctobacter heliothermus TaxID=74033 RepID=A0A222E356_9RHOB|nr:extracellular solute-binding protein [Antarctobacter heliothermus]ASP20616.1 thiamine transporter substrate binding subunit [Antarctobacter heliothermus]
MFYKSLTTTAVVATLAIAEPAKADDVVVYSGNNSSTVEAVMDYVSENMPDLEVTVVAGNTGALMQRIQAEVGSAQGDIFWSAGFATLGAYSDLFQPHNSEATNTLPKTMVGPDGLWTGTNTHVMVLMVNERQLRGLEAPETWSDVFDPKWEGKLIMGDPEKSSSAYAQVYGLYQTFGQDGLDALAKVAVITNSSSQVYKSVAAGEFPVGITMEYSAYAYVDGGQDEIKLVYPTEGTYLSPEGMGMIAGAPNSEGAAKMMDLLASPGLQEHVFRATFRRPVSIDVDVTEIAGLPAIADIKVHDFDQLEAAENREDVLAAWRAAKDAAK